jgi:uncharacterized membrane protein YfcA
VILYWLGSMHEPAIVRANFISYFGIFAVASAVTYAAHGLLTPLAFALAIVLSPLHIVSLWAGTRLFHFASERVYRRIAYALIAAAALVSMPLFDQIGR